MNGDPLAIDPRELLDVLADAIVVASRDGVIDFVNQRAEELFRASAAELVGRPLTTVIPERLRPQHQAGFAGYLESGRPTLIGGKPVRLPALRADGTEVEIELALSVHRNEAGREMFVATLRDLSERIELERQRDVARYLSISRDVTSRLAMTADVATLEDAAPVLLAALGEGLGWDGGTVWSTATGVALPIAHWGPGSDELALTMTGGVSFRIGEGLPGLVAASGEAIWAETVSDTAVFTRKARAQSAGVESAFAFPVKLGRGVAAVVEMYSRKSQPPEPELLAVLQAAGAEIGRYLEQEQSRRHLVEMAEALQASLLPPAPPVLPGLDIAVRYRAAAGEGQVGGDFFDVFPLPDGEWAVLIGDVSGRGPRAAALTALARYTLRAAAIGAVSPSAVLKVLNDVVRRELESAYEGDERFLTVAYLTVKPSGDGYALDVACGGHPFPLARRADGTVEEIRCEGELIGAFDAHESVDNSVELAAGDAVVLVTDGVIEARADGVQFGDERLRAVVAEHGKGTASELADAIEQAVLMHLGGHGQDDVAIVVLRFPPVESPVTTGVDLQTAESL